MKRRTFIAATTVALAGPLAPRALQARASKDSSDVLWVIQQLAERRTAQGLPLPRTEPTLQWIANRQSLYLCSQGVATHHDQDGRNPEQSAYAYGYPGQLLGQAIAETRARPDLIMEAWYNDAETRSVLMDPRLSQLGLSAAQSPHGTKWWVALAGAPSTSV